MDELLQQRYLARTTRVVLDLRPPFTFPQMLEHAAPEIKKKRARLEIREKRRPAQSAVCVKLPADLIKS
jgi:hypothetical protein